MNMSESSGKMFTDSRIDRYLDGDMVPDERDAFEELMGQNDLLERETRLAERVLEGLHTLCTPAIPDRVARGVRHTMRRDLRADIRDWFRMIYPDLLRPALAMTSLLVIVLSAALLGRRPGIVSESGVESARQEIEWTLAYLSKVSRRTGSEVRRTAIEPLIVGPMSNAVRVLSGTHSDRLPGNE
jgi:anti-sigma factor RsiW